MSRLLTTAEFINNARKVHGRKYNYNNVNYINSNTKINISCNKCKLSFFQRPSNHLNGRGCHKCGGSKQSNTNEFISKSSKLHGSKFDYSYVKYINWKTEVTIKCNICKNIFKQIPNCHLNGNGCPICANKNKTTETFVISAKKLHHKKFDYSYVVYIGNKNKIKIKCNTCNFVFVQTPDNHLHGNGCPKCAGRHKTTNEFISSAIKIHGYRFNYSPTKYVDSKTKILIECNECKFNFTQLPHDHLNGNGCPKCKSSKGELEIIKFLKNNNISYSHQHKFDTLVGIGNYPLKYDFYIQSKNILIEFDGEQHFNSRFFKNKNIPIYKFDRLKEHDIRKNKYAMDNDITLIRIPYYDIKKISDILSVKLL